MLLFSRRSFNHHFWRLPVARGFCGAPRRKRRFGRPGGAGGRVLDATLAGVPGLYDELKEKCGFLVGFAVRPLQKGYNKKQTHPYATNPVLPITTVVYGWQPKVPPLGNRNHHLEGPTWLNGEVIGQSSPNPDYPLYTPTPGAANKPHWVALKSFHQGPPLSFSAFFT